MRGPRDPIPARDRGGAGSQSPADDVLQFAKVVTSSLSQATSVPLYNVEGPVDSSTGMDLYSALGVVSRPLPPEVRDGRGEHAEVVCIRTVEGLVPIAVRDVRLRMQGNAPLEGTVALVGYGSAFHAMVPVAKGGDPAGGGAVHTVYCPFDFDADGVAQKAHSVNLDPTPDNESVTVAHADGMSVVLFDGKAVIRSADGSAYIEVDDGNTRVVGNVQLVGAVSLGEDGAGGQVPVLIDPTNIGTLATQLLAAGAALRSAGLDPTLAALAPTAAGFLATAGTALNTAAGGAAPAVFTRAK